MTSSVAAVIVAAGRGTRAGGDLPKQYRALAGEPVIRSSLSLFSWHGEVGAVQAVIHPDDVPAYDAAAKGLKLMPPVFGGATRQASVRAGLEALSAYGPDIVLVHDIGRAEHGPDYEARLRCVLDETLPELEAMRREGLLGWIGVGVNEPGPVLDLLGRAPLDCALIAGRYTLLEQPALDALERCAEAGVRVIAGGVFNSGLLASSPR